MRAQQTLEQVITNLEAAIKRKEAILGSLDGMRGNPEMIYVMRENIEISLEELNNILTSLKAL